MRWPATLLILLVCGVGACSRSTMANYYVLTPPSHAPAGNTDGPSVGVRPVILPGYVDRDNIVTMAGPQRLRLDDGNVWAEPLDENMTRVLAECLAGDLATDHVHFQPWPQGTVDYRVSVSVLNVTGTLGGEAVLQAFWTVHAENDEPDLVAAHRADLRRPAGEGYDSFAAALSDMLAELSGEIAKAIRRNVP